MRWIWRTQAKCGATLDAAKLSTPSAPISRFCFASLWTRRSLSILHHLNIMLTLDLLCANRFRIRILYFLADFIVSTQSESVEIELDSNLCFELLWIISSIINSNRERRDEYWRRQLQFRLRLGRNKCRKFPYKPFQSLFRWVALHFHYFLRSDWSVLCISSTQNTRTRT